MVRRYRFSAAHLLGAIVATFVILPLVEEFAYGTLIEVVLFTIVLQAGISAVGARRRTHLFAISLAAPTILFRWLNHLFPQYIPPEIYLVGAIIFVSFVMAHLFRFVVTSPDVTAEVLYASISIYLLFAVVFASVFTLVTRFAPNSIVYDSPYDNKPVMESFTALYFSMQMLTSINFGDITPAANITRTIALFEGMIGSLYMTILVGRLVGLYTSDADRAPPHPRS